MVRVAMVTVGLLATMAFVEGDVGAGRGAQGGDPVAPTTIVLETDAGMHVRVHPGSWWLVDVVGGGRLLRVEVGFGGCTEFDHLEVAESDDRVQVVAVMETMIVPDDRDGPPYFACTDDLGLRVEDVRLKQPLGDRHLVGECSGGKPECWTFPSRSVRRR